MATYKIDRNIAQTYVIFSIDTEHDTIKHHSTRTAGWSKGIPLLCETFDTLAMRGKVCWLIEYNLKEGIPAANPNSEFFVKELHKLIAQIKIRGDELGVHPSMYDWVDKKKQISLATYGDPDSWDLRKSYHEPEFVMDLVTSAVKDLEVISEIKAVGCRTAAFHYATHLANALQKNGIKVDSSILKKGWRFLASPNAYYASGEDIRRKSISRNGVLEIPTISCAQFRINMPHIRLRTEYLLHMRKPVFLSFYIHNWDAITSDGMKNESFLDNLTSFLSFLHKRGVCFLSWTEAKEIFDSFYGIK